VVAQAFPEEPGTWFRFRQSARECIGVLKVWMYGIEVERLPSVELVPARRSESA
jgi:hypothetical protein